MRYINIAIINIAIFVGLAIPVIWPATHDATDPADGRSGLVLFTDAGTGCQYLGRPIFGALQPRLDAAGGHICGRAQ